MTQDDVIKLWEKANGWSVKGFQITFEELQSFANLVAAKAFQNGYEKALAQPEQEGYWKENAQGLQRDYDLLLADFQAQRTFVGLTDVEIEQAIELISMLHGDYATEVAYAIEAKLKELNT